MSTISGNLALLQRTKAGQRALLEEMYPDMDFSTVPFREYGRLFSGRKYVPGFIGGWKAYGRSNSEDASTRDILPDYSGNGRDIRLYNFGFTGMSGYGGYACDFNNFSISTGAEGLVITKSYDRLHIEVSDTFNYRLGINMAAEKWNAARGRTVKVTSSYDDEESIKLVYSSGSDAYIDILLNGDTVIPAYSEEPSTYIYLDLSKVMQKSGIIDIELLPEYPGALVSDGIDDYGQCVKDFSLPDDYTVVAIRQKLGGKSVLAGKSRDSKNGAFLFENNNLTYNYGVSTSVTGSVPALFSYQTKSSYNGVDLNVGDGTDTEEDKFMLFMMRPNADKWSSYALYDLRIYDHSLTAEELQAVKDEMMADYEAATGGA